MKSASFTSIVQVLNKAGVRFMVAGGLAVNAHGFLRFTKDADLVIELVPNNIQAAFTALEGLGYRPNVPIAASDFADGKKRASWIQEKGMLVLQFWSDDHRETPLDIFVQFNFDFEEELSRALHKPLRDGNDVAFVSLERLLAMKRVAGRPQDLQDIHELSWRLGNDVST
ncbi:MAG TPA: nucleotidyl transferase AbiEii/AbiGii toxin family protein [Chthoniobacterales bacterium]|jgi:hypothetical protein